MARSAPVVSSLIRTLLASLVGVASSLAGAAGATFSASYGMVPLQFEANEGQAPQDVLFLSHGPGYSLYLTSSQAVLVLAKSDTDRKPHLPANLAIGSTQAQAEASTQVHGVALSMRLVGGPRMSPAGGVEKLPGVANYFIGNDPVKWHTNVPTYAKVHYREAYPGVDLFYYGNQHQLEFDFVVAPGIDPNKITLEFQGVEKLEIDARGDLVLHTSAGGIHQRKPYIYQVVDGKRRPIDGGYVLKGPQRVGFKVFAYDTSQRLVIDPVLAYSTFLGGGGSGSQNGGSGIAVDSAGNAYVTGYTTSANFPTTSGAFQSTDLPLVMGSGDAFVTKLNPTGTGVVYSTYFGGNDVDFGNGVAVDANGNAYVTGATRSVNYPTTPLAFQLTKRGPTDTVSLAAFLTILNPSGNSLVYSTYLGGSAFTINNPGTNRRCGDSTGNGIAVDSSGNAYVTGSTTSLDFPTTFGAFQSTVNFSGADCPNHPFVTKINPANTALVYSTYLAGSSYDLGYGIAVDGDGNAFVTGSTLSADFPVTSGAVQPTLAGPSDCFITKVNSLGAGLVYSTFLGGSGNDSASAIAVAANGNAFVTGNTRSVDFPTTAQGFQLNFAGGSGNAPTDAFVTKLNPTGSGLLYSTYLGGSDNDYGAGIAVDASGNAYLTGLTYSATFPTTGGAPQSIYRGGGDAFITKIDPTGSVLIYSTFLGGSPSFGSNGQDYGSGIAVDASGNAYVVGTTAWSADFPTTTGAFQTTPASSNSNAFVTKVVD